MGEVEAWKVSGKLSWRRCAVIEETGISRGEVMRSRSHSVAYELRRRTKAAVMSSGSPVETSSLSWINEVEKDS
jgi:hypothetical protein